MNKLKSKTKVFFLSLFGGMFLILVGHLFLSQQIVSIDKKTQQLQRQVGELVSQEQQIKLAQKDTDTILDDYKKVQNVFVGKESVIDLIQLIEHIAQKVTVSLKINRVTKQELIPVSETKETILIDITASGDKKNTLTFLEAIEYLPFKSGIKHVVLHEEIPTGTTTKSFEINSVLSFVKSK